MFGHYFCRPDLNNPPTVGGCPKRSTSQQQKTWHLAQFDPLVDSKRLPATCVQPPAVGGIHRIVQSRSEEHTSELQSLRHLVCRLLLEKKKNYRRSSLR